MADGDAWTLTDLQRRYAGRPAVQHEYMAIQNQRVAMVNLMHIWHQIGFPAAVLVYATLIGQSGDQHSAWHAVAAFLLAVALLFMVRLYARRLDAKAIMLYPRIVTLEVVLGFRFYRDYLSRAEVVPAGRRGFVQEAEALAARGTLDLDEYSRQVSGAFCPLSFPASRRGHRELDLMAWGLGVVFGVISAVRFFLA